MSLDATIWAWKADVDTSPQRVTLLALADRAGEQHTCYPSVARLVKDTKLNRKTVMKVLDELEQKFLIKFTGKKVGNGVKVYQLMGVVGRENDHKEFAVQAPTRTNFGTSSKNGTSTKNGTATSPKNGTATSTKNGTQNLSMNLSIESKNKKTWFCFEKLREEFVLIDAITEFEEIKNANWLEREKRAFENYNAQNHLCDDLMIYHFVDWLLNAKAKYQKSEAKKTTPKNSPTQLSEKQIAVFATKLAHHPEFAGKYSEAGESYEALSTRIAIKLENSKQAKAWESYLKQVGFAGELAA